MYIYLDIDQVLRTNDNKLAPHARQFLETVTKQHAYWLTADYGGSVELALRRLTPLLNHDEINLVSIIDSTKWDLLRTEAIDFRQPFLWFTHSVDEFEMEDLERHNCVENLHIINTSKNPEALQSFIHHLPQPVRPDLTHSPYRYSKSA